MLAGGTDLIVQVREYLRDWDVFIDAKRIPELMALSLGRDGSLTLGAAVACAVISTNPQIARTFAGLVDAASIIGGVAIQSRASLGGNLCNSGPAADSIPTLIAYAVTCNIAGPNGRRSVPVEDFCSAPGRNVLRPDELLVSLSFPVPALGSGVGYLRFIPRGEMDIAVVGAAAQVVLDGGTITAARVALGAVAPTPLYVPEAGAAIVGRPASEDAYALAAAAAQAAARPITDMRGTAEHRRHLVGILTTRALRRAVERASGVAA
jgi:carbon-monoxide dehydrogenase medium subunit